MFAFRCSRAWLPIFAAGGMVMKDRIDVVFFVVGFFFIVRARVSVVVVFYRRSLSSFIQVFRHPSVYN